MSDDIDIIERLGDFWPDDPADRKLIADSTREIERLRAEIEKLRDQNKLFRGALDFVAAYRALDFDPQKNLAASHMSIVAREALEGKP